MSDETAPQSRIKITWLIGTLAAFAIFAIIAGYSARMTNDYTGYDQQRGPQRYETLKKVQGAEQLLINPVDAQGKPTAEWVDQAKGVIRIPIQEAMALEVTTLKDKPAKAGTEIAVAAPAAAPPAKTNAAPASAPSTNAPASAKPKAEKK